MPDKTRKLADLISIGPAMLRDFEMLGIRSVAQLAKRDPQRMYEKMERLTGQRQDPCVLDTFCAAVAQAKNPRLPAEKGQRGWWRRMKKKRSKDKKKQGSKESKKKKTQRRRVRRGARRD